MNRRARARRAAATIAVAGATAAGLAVVPSLAASAASVGDAHGNASSLPPTGAIKHVIVIDLENEDESTTFGPNSPATYLNDTLLPARRVASRTTTRSGTSAWTTTSRRSPARRRTC